MNCYKIQSLFKEYNENVLSKSTKESMKKHLNNCKYCWDKWNFWRWNKSINHELIIDLKDYLGLDFKVNYDSSWALAEEWSNKKRISQNDIDEFYITSKNYLYNLAIWEASGNRPNYVEQAIPILKNLNCKTILDFGCGIGNDGVKLLKNGYKIIFFDISIANLDFLSYRLNKEQLENYIIINTFSNLIDINYDTIWAMDVIEHLSEPFSIFSDLLLKNNVFIYDTDHAGTSNGRQPFHFQHNTEKFQCFLKSFNFKKKSEFLPLNVWTKDS